MGLAWIGGGLGVYPRVCGGTKPELDIHHVRKGLSPRVRGNHPYEAQLRKELGSIPACAGEPTHASVLSPAARVYPRVCGGTAPMQVVKQLRQGLSPRVRGNP